MEMILDEEKQQIKDVKVKKSAKQSSFGLFCQRSTLANNLQ